MGRIDDPAVHSPNGSDIIGFVRAMAASGYNLGYRGHANASWELKPTLARFHDDLASKGRTQRSYLELQRLVRARFEENLIVNGDLRPDQIANMDLWEYGQHFGLPTPLLDWTTSPYVGLFFAAHDPCTNDRGLRSLWMLNLDILRSVNQLVLDYLQEGQETLLRPIKVQNGPSYFNKRLAYQQGFFTRHDYFNGFEPWMREAARVLSHPNSDPQLLSRIEFSLSEKQRSEVLSELNSMNINSRVLFPDIKGSADYARDVVEHDIQPRTVKMSFSSD